MSKHEEKEPEASELVQELRAELKEQRTLVASVLALLAEGRGDDRPMKLSDMTLERGLSATVRAKLEPPPAPELILIMILILLVEPETGRDFSQTMEVKLVRRWNEREFSAYEATPKDQTELRAIAREHCLIGVRDVYARAERDGDKIKVAELDRLAEYGGVPGHPQARQVRYAAGWLQPLKQLIGRPWSKVMAHGNVKVIEGEVPPPREVAA